MFDFSTLTGESLPKQEKQFLDRISSEAAVSKCSTKFSLNLQDNTYGKASLLIKLQAFL